MLHRFYLDLAKKTQRALGKNARDHLTLRARRVDLRVYLAQLEEEIEDDFLERHGPGCPSADADTRRGWLRSSPAAIRVIRAALVSSLVR